MTLTKPAPPAPKFVRQQMPVTPKNFNLPTKQLERYALPMYSEFVPAWVQVLRDCGYPTDILVIDFETFYDSDFGMGDTGLSTIEYVRDPRFEVLGVSILTMKARPLLPTMNSTSRSVREKRPSSKSWRTGSLGTARTWNAALSSCRTPPSTR